MCLEHMVQNIEKLSIFFLMGLNVQYFKSKMYPKNMLKTLWKGTKYSPSAELMV